MKDERGIYYFPSLQDRSLRMYVRRNEDNGQVEFRMYNADHPQVWERHGWLPHEVITKAAAMFRERGSDRNPAALYDLDVAEKLLSEEQ